MKRACVLLQLILAACNISVAQDTKDVFTYKVGSYEVVMLSEGQSNGNPQILIGATPEMLQKLAPSETFPMATNAFLVKTPQQNILIDAGHGRKLFDNLAQAGVTPEQVAAILITHMHGDHIGGLMKDGKPTFNAPLSVSQSEYAYWSSKDEMAKQPEGRQKGFLATQKVFEAYTNLEQLSPQELGEQTGDGVFPIASYGHTLGHVSYLVRSKGEQLLIWGDLTHALAIQMPYPQVAVTYDIDPQQAVESRLRILDYVAKHKIPVAGMHIPFPAIGIVEADASTGGYTFTPEKSK